MQFPKMYDTNEAAELLNLSPETLKNFRAALTGPNFVRLGGSIKYLEEDLLDWLKAQRQLPPIDGSKAASPAAIQSALTMGYVGMKEALAQRSAELAALDAADRNVVNNPYAVTVAGVGETPGSNIEKFSSVPPTPVPVAPAPHLLNGR